MSFGQVRAARIARPESVVRHAVGGAIYMRSPHPLGAYPLRLTDALERWATEAGDRPFLAQRDRSGEWRTIGYAETLNRVRRLAQGLLDRKLSRDRPVMILSGNGIDHALLALASMYVGVPYAPISPAYSLQTRDYVTLRQLFARVEPGLVFAAEGAPFERALNAVRTADVEVVISSDASISCEAARLPDVEATPTVAVDAARDAVGADTIAKVLFTSGSTGRPKGVINTQRMLCSNQVMIRSVYQFLGDAPPVLCDWSPWNHTAGGNHNFGIALHNGGTLYIDEGKPTPAQFATTLNNLREVACTAHFAVPRLYEMLLPALRRDAALRRTFFSRLQLLFYAAAGLGQRFWDELREIAVEECGEEILIATGLGCTETAPFAMTTGAAPSFAGMVGWPAPGLELKLAPEGDKFEARVRGPNVTPGYWRDPALTEAAFDDEGFYRMGDALRLVDPDDARKGLIFDGRLAEDFKLSTGTWVSVGPLRAKILAQAGGFVQDVVIAGHDREYVAALIVPNVGMCRQVAGAGDDAPAGEVLADARVAAEFRRILTALARESTGTSTYVARAMLLDDPPSLDAREITDKGSLNQKILLANRADLVEELYSPVPSARVIVSAASPA